MERTLVLVKPDGVQRGLIGTVIKRFEDKGLQIAGLKLMHVTEDLAHEHYKEHVGKPFFDGLLNFITSSPVAAIAVDGEGAIAIVRNMMGETNPAKAAPGTIRGDFGVDFGLNIVHGSDGLESAERELALFFDRNELIDYDRAIQAWITA
ncbi:MAG: nucleoside-diphosphate kinase [Chloroflexi bacterium]|nr:nucleoside-diphosphate kinase [Chloroflexota bacterium]|tara:strand:- start:531 stop:980 length:450 start_codon:yes stop_codon:yes gene_type:complete